MSTHYRGNRILNASGRRLGPQLPLDVQQGRTPRMLSTSDFDSLVPRPIPQSDRIANSIAAGALLAALIGIGAWIFERVISLLAGAV